MPDTFLNILCIQSHLTFTKFYRPYTLIDPYFIDEENICKLCHAMHGGDQRGFSKHYTHHRYTIILTFSQSSSRESF